MKKIIGLIMSISLILSFVCNFPVIAFEDSSEVVTALTALGIIQGNESGDLMLDKKVTRAEFATIVTRILNVSNTGVKEVFTDVPVTHWANPTINICYNLGIISGYNDTTFGPEDPVTYEQAVKMLVIALGYEPVAVQKGGYPTGYMVAANSCGLTKGVSAGSQSAPALRNTIVELVYNAIDIPLMEQTGFGDNIEYTILDGTNYKDYKTLMTELDVIKLEGVVVGTPIIAYEGQTSDKDAITYQVKSVDGNEYWENKLDVAIDIKVADGVKAADYFGISSIAYVYEKSKNRYEIIAITPNKDSNVVTFGIEDVHSVTEKEIEYYVNNGSKTNKYKLDEDFLCYYNYGSKELEDIVDLDTDIEFTLIDNDANNKFDIVFAKAYESDIIESIDIDSYDLDTKKGESFEIDFEDDDMQITLVDADGAAIGLEDCAEDDIIAYISGDNWIEIINLGDNTIEGAVEEKTSDGAVYINGKKYEQIGDIAGLKSEGIFYLTKTNKIFDYKPTSSSASNYAIVLDCGEDSSSFNQGYQVKLLTKDGDIVIYNVRESSIDAYKDKLDALATDGDNIKEDVEDRLITFKLNTKNEIREITFVTPKKLKADSEYDLDGESLGSTDINMNAIVFNVDTNSIDSCYATSTNYFVNEGIYNGYYAETDDEVDCIIITEGGSKIDYTQDLAIVAEVTDITINEGSDDAKKIRYYVSGNDELEEIIVVKDEDVTDLIDTDYEDINVGDAFMFNGGDIVTAFAVVADYAEHKYTLNSAVVENIESDANADTTFVVGHIEDWSPVSAGVKITSVEGESFVIKGSTNKYTFENRSRADIIHVGNWKKGDVDEADTEANYFIARKVKNNVNDFIVISNRIPLE